MSSRRAVVLGGTGGIGSQVVRELLDVSGRGGDDWEVEVVSRSGGPVADGLLARGAVGRPGDRRDTTFLRELLRPGADLLVDTVGATRDDALQLAPFLDDVGSTVFVSSKAVYADEQGRHANSLDKPVFGGAVTELQPTVTPADADPTSRDGYGAAKVAAEQVLLDHGAPVTVLRPSKVYGVGIGRPREWFVVRRVLDGRERVLLADEGRGVDHTTAASGIASLVRIVADAPDRRILNVADETAPTALEIVRTVAGHLGHTFDEVLLGEDAPRVRRTHALVGAVAVRARHHRCALARVGPASVRGGGRAGGRLVGRDGAPHAGRRGRAVGGRSVLGPDVRLRAGGRGAGAAVARAGLTGRSG
ncbi:NAD(P)-dependent oxidoreductase [Curtobacterium sp. MCPF17_052]|uniref:NAD-dependent epimerase/dehydratase family protein n=1 Tax=Curtobacterium sp. MCPF17_052 TaxID=2175655 RepID=UPI0024DFF4D5|nr:NAD-dependent epimerase/dehydratase family protein [Curtobacterium sp. MCPF17_052]WIB13363.1 NAD-dependent epimerase/dehydratase family protein [Curtobacterium sp. MCPF17_052]